MQFFKACILLASIVLNVEVLPVSEEYGTYFWAKLCNSCEERKYVVSTQLTCYNNLSFTHMVAAHEVCHLALGHTGDWLLAHGHNLAEEQVSECLLNRFGYTEKDIQDLDDAATKWDERDGMCR